MSAPVPNPAASTPEGNPPADPQPTPPADPTELSPEEAAALRDPGKQAIDRMKAALAAAEGNAAQMAARLKEIDDRDLSELQKAQRDREEALTEAQKARVDSLRWRTAAAHGISTEDAELFLTGHDEETMTAQAVRLAAKLAAPTKPELRPDPSMGPRGGGGSDPRQQFADILKQA